MTSILKNVYIEKLADIVNKYNDTHHSTIKVKCVDVKTSTYSDFVQKTMKKIINLRLVTM